MDEERKVGRVKPFDVINIIIMIIFIFIMAYPLWFIIVGAFNEGKDYMRGGVYLWPRVWTLDNFKAVFRDRSIIGAFAVTGGNRDQRAVYLPGILRAVQAES